MTSSQRNPQQPTRQGDDRRARMGRLVRFAMLVLSVLVAGLVWVTWYGGGNPVDAKAFYDPDYSRPTFEYLWTPAFAQLTTPLRLLDFTAFVAVVRAAELAALVALAPYGAWAFLLLPPVAAEVNAANINLLLMLCIALSVRHPAAWVLPLLTKPSAAVAMLWYLARREWRALAVPVVVTGVITLISFALDPGQWLAWAGKLVQYGDTPGWPFPWPVWPRLPIAALVVLWGARTNRPWTVVLAAIVGYPRLYFMSIAMLVGMLPLMGRQPRWGARVRPAGGAGSGARLGAGPGAGPGADAATADQARVVTQ